MSTTTVVEVVAHAISRRHAVAVAVVAVDAMEAAPDQVVETSRSSIVAVDVDVDAVDATEAVPAQGAEV